MWASAGLAPLSADEIYNPDWAVADWGLTWDDIARLDFAIYLDNMFQYGHFGLRDTGWEPMEDGTGYTWTALVLMDLSSSQFLSEWSEGYGGEGRDSIARCLQVAELANARLVLETGEPFCSPLSARERGNEAGIDGLTVRQMALLAGMEEMSIRAAANPKRPNALATFSDDGRTRIAPDVAKRWLESKGRYVAVRTFHSGRNNDLGKRPFNSLEDVVERCRQNVYSLRLLGDDEIDIPDERVAAFLEDGKNGYSDAPAWGPELQREALSDPAFVAALAQCLKFPAELLALRVRELLAKEELQRVQHTLREMTHVNGDGHA